jgi:hypothetical protein
MEVTMDTQDSERDSVDGTESAIARARTRVSQAVGHMPELAGKARDRAEKIAERLPEAMSRVQAGAQTTVTRLQTRPDSELSMLAAASIGMGAGLRLAGASRLATLAGLAPASILGFAILSRKGRTQRVPQQIRP